MNSMLKFIWQLPQTILGWLLLLFYRPEKKLVYKGKKVYVCGKFPSGISLGYVIIVKKYPTNQALWNVVKHEWGHTRQSEKWGWLYLLVIGLPSVIGNVFDRLFHKGWSDKDSGDWYYNLPWEKSADKYGDVVR